MRAIVLMIVFWAAAPALCVESGALRPSASRLPTSCYDPTPRVPLHVMVTADETDGGDELLCAAEDEGEADIALHAPLISLISQTTSARDSSAAAAHHPGRSGHCGISDGITRCNC